MRAESALRVVSIYPTLLGTYGDGGNLRVLAQRARARGYDVEAIELDAGEPVPATADLYLLGGGEDDAQVAAARTLRRDDGFRSAVSAGAVVFAVCAGYQLLGEQFPGAEGVLEPGLALLDVST
ncbi:MAG: glutamine amidotransferase, partial [Acidothermaceae bacterium]